MSAPGSVEDLLYPPEAALKVIPIVSAQAELKVIPILSTYDRVEKYPLNLVVRAPGGSISPCLLPASYAELVKDMNAELVDIQC